MTIRATPTLTTCELCSAPMAAVRGPFSVSIGRPAPPNGYRLGYIVELAQREYPICKACLDHVLKTAA